MSHNLNEPKKSCAMTLLCYTVSVHESLIKKCTKYFPHTTYLFEDQLSYILILQYLLEFGSKDQNEMLFFAYMVSVLESHTPFKFGE